MMFVTRLLCSFFLNVDLKILHFLAHIRVLSRIYHIEWLKAMNFLTGVRGMPIFYLICHLFFACVPHIQKGKGRVVQHHAVT